VLQNDKRVKASLGFFEPSEDFCQFIKKNDQQLLEGRAQRKDE
jgi:hypothetical protein